LGNGFEIRPRENLFQREFILSDEIDQSFFMNFIADPFRPKRVICFVQLFFADGFSSASYTQGDVSDRSSRNFALGYDIFAFQAGKTSTINLCIKISSREKGKSACELRGE